MANQVEQKVSDGRVWNEYHLQEIDEKNGKWDKAATADQQKDHQGHE